MRALFQAFVLCAVLLSQASWAEVEVDDEALMAKRPAKLLSAYGLFRDGASQLPSAGVYPYDLQQPLFTDYAHKYRFIYMPAGQSAAYSADETFEFPVGTVLVKTFAYPADFRKPVADIQLIETRLLIHQQDGWNAWAYVWNEDASDAVLKVAGKSFPVSWTDETGKVQNIQYVVPNKNQCKGCHTYNKKFTPIGPKARNLNKDFPYSHGSKNQLSYWSSLGLLRGAPSHGNIPSVPKFDDATAPLGARARAYLDINCAHCHRLEGPASTSGLYLTYGEKNAVNWGYKKRPVAAGRGSGNLHFDIVPGKPDLSILIYRMISTDPAVMMPEVGRTTVHKEGVELIEDWIAGLE